MNQTNHSIIFIPGFKGSELCDQNKRLIWPHVLRAQFSNVSLSYNLPDLELQNQQQYHATDIVRSVPLIPPFFRYDIYGRFIDNLNEKFSQKAHIVTFHYDWREPLLTTVSKLNNLIVKLQSQGINKIDLICHSMGGLIASYLLRYGKSGSELNGKQWSLTSTINRIFFIATPFKGSIKILHDLIYGNKIGFNYSLLSPASLGSFPSSYYLLPSYPGSVVIKNKLTDIDRSIFDLEIWQNFRIGLLNNSIKDQAVMTKRANYIGKCLSASKDFYTLLYAKDEVQPESPVKIIVIVSQTRETLYKLVIDQSSGKFTWETQQGDGSIPILSSHLPDSFSSFHVTEHLVDAEHSKMFLDKQLQEILWYELRSSI